MVVSGIKDLENPNSPELYLGGVDQEPIELRAAAALTTGYVVSKVLNISQCRSILLMFNLSGSGITSSTLKIQFGHTGLLYDINQIEVDNNAPPDFGDPTFVLSEFQMGGTTKTWCMPIVNPGCTHMRCSAKANAGDGSLQILAMRGQSGGNWPMTWFGV